MEEQFYSVINGQNLSEIADKLNFVQGHYQMIEIVEIHFSPKGSTGLRGDWWECLVWCGKANKEEKSNG